MNLSRIVVFLFCIVVASCNSGKKIVYMQDALDQRTEEVTVYKGIVVQPKDELSIVVAGADPILVYPFNLPLHSYQAGSSSATSYMQRLLGYHVDMEGYIDFPFLGKIKVSGLTREQVSELIKQKLVQGGLLYNPIVNTEIMNFKISVLGEVSYPGTFHLTSDIITVLEAIGRAGDLTIYGNRENVLVRREQNGLITYYRLNLLSTDFMRSPAFYLQQNDVVYIEPNNTVAARSRINENRSMNTLLSLGSLLSSLAVVIMTR